MVNVTKIKSGSVFEDKYSYSRVVAVGDLVLVSNTAGRNYKTREIADNAVDQARQAFVNLEAALAAVDASLADVVRSRVLIPRLEDVHPVLELVGEKFRGIDPVSTVTCTPLAGEEYLFEIEVTAHRGMSESKTTRREIVIG